MYYVLYQASTNKLIGVSNADPYQLGLPDISIIEIETLPNLVADVWDENSLTFVTTAKHILTRFQFMSKFADSERQQVYSSTHPVVVDILKTIEIVDYVDLFDPNTIRAVQALAMLELIPAHRVSEILSTN